MASSRSRRSDLWGGLARLRPRRRPERVPAERSEATGRKSLAAATRARRAAAEMADEMLAAAGAETAWHSREVQRIALRMADRLGLSGPEREAVGIAGRLHDIGKVAMPRSLLEKTGPPTPDEWALIHRHTVVGERILRSVEELRSVAGLVRHSHERWDGSGYPDRLRGEQIPLGSRIVFCADAFHAICTDRPYRAGRSVAAALAEIRRCAGTQFEPGAVEALTQVVRDGLYGPHRRSRRRSHSKVSILLVFAVSLGGSIAAGIAAGGGSPTVPDHTSGSVQDRAAPSPPQDARRHAPGAAARGSVAGALAKGGEAVTELELAPTPPPAALQPPPASTTPTRPREQKPPSLVAGSSNAIPPVTEVVPALPLPPAVSSKLESTSIPKPPPIPSAGEDENLESPAQGDAGSQAPAPANEEPLTRILG